MGMPYFESKCPARMIRKTGVLWLAFVTFTGCEAARTFGWDDKGQKDKYWRGGWRFFERKARRVIRKIRYHVLS